MKALRRRWPEWLVLALFVTLAIGTIVAPLSVPALSDQLYAPAFNTALSVGTGGIVSFIFYYVVNERLERRRFALVRQGALRSYRNAKHNIATAIIHASYKGGRHDLVADGDTVGKVLTIPGFKELFEEGREADEGFYAFQNQMSDRTPEFDEILFNLKMMSRAFERLMDAGGVDDHDSYNLFVRLDSVIRRIEHNGAGYDESKLLCRFIWEVFAGWDLINGSVGYDRIERTLSAQA